MTCQLPLADRPDLLRYVDGAPVLSALAAAYLFNVTEDEVREHARKATPGGVLPWPKAWVRQGKETVARLGVSTMAEALTLLVAEREA